MRNRLPSGNPKTVRTWVIIGVCVFGVVLLLTVFNLAFQPGDTAAFPNTLFKSLQIDTFARWGLVIFCALCLCFLILGYPRSRK